MVLEITLNNSRAGRNGDHGQSKLRDRSKQISPSRRRWTAPSASWFQIVIPG